MLFENDTIVTSDPSFIILALPIGNTKSSSTETSNERVH